jgi:CRP/FNR family transcriptional regulator, cyclic AMP receptor protein
VTRWLRFGRRRSHPDEIDAARHAEKLGLLRASDLFRDLSEQDMVRVEEMTLMTQCEKGRIIYSPGEVEEALFLLKRGKVHVYRVTPDGRKLITAIIEPDTLFGNMALTGSKLTDSFAEALENSVLCVMSRTDLEDLINEFPAVAMRLIDRLSGRMRELEARLEEGLLRDMPSRVAASLLRLREGAGSEEVATTHQELADTLGTYRETVTATLGELQARGYIELHRGCIRILDHAGLRDLISSDIPD